MTTFTRKSAKAIAVFATVTMLSSTALAQDFKLKFASPFPSGHPADTMAKEYIEQIEKETNNRIKISYFPAEQLGKAKDMLSLCGSGVSDFCQVHIPYFSGRLPYNNIAALPHWTHATEGAVIYQALIETVPQIQEEFAKYRVRGLYGTATPNYDIATSSKPVRSLSDLKGMKLKTGGGLFDTIAKRYGVNPVTIPAPETYEAIQRNLAEGVVFNYPSIKSYHLNDLIKYATRGVKGGGYPVVLTISLKTWSQLPGDIKEAVLKVSSNAAANDGALWDKLSTDIVEEFIEQGIEIYELTDEDKKQWSNQLEGIDDDFIEEARSRGAKDIDEVMERYREIVIDVVGEYN